MGRGVGHHRGGIGGLARLLTEHEGAIRRDLLCAGLRLDDAGTEALSWLDLLAFCKWSPEDSALYASINPYAVSDQLQVLGLIELHLNYLRWFKTDGAKHGRNRPQPLPFLRPKDEVKEYTPMTADEMDAFLGWSPRELEGSEG